MIIYITWIWKTYVYSLDKSMTILWELLTFTLTYLCHEIASILKIYYRPPTKLREGNVFNRVRVCSQGKDPMRPSSMMHWTSQYRNHPPQPWHPVTPPQTWDLTVQGPPLVVTYDGQGWRPVQIYNKNRVFSLVHSGLKCACIWLRTNDITVTFFGNHGNFTTLGVGKNPL